MSRTTNYEILGQLPAKKKHSVKYVKGLRVALPSGTSAVSPSSGAY